MIDRPLERSYPVFPIAGLVKMMVGSLGFLNLYRVGVGTIAPTGWDGWLHSVASIVAVIALFVDGAAQTFAPSKHDDFWAFVRGTERDNRVLRYAILVGVGLGSLLLVEAVLLELRAIMERGSAL